MSASSPSAADVKQGAADRSEGGMVDLESYDWDDRGIAPTGTQSSTYEPEVEPTAEFDNNWNFEQRVDDRLLNKALGDLESQLDNLEDRVGNVRNDLDVLTDRFNRHNHDTRYYKQYIADDLFVNETGDEMTGDLRMLGNAVRFERTDERDWRIERHEARLAAYIDDTGGREFEIDADGKSYESATGYLGGEQLATHPWTEETQLSAKRDDFAEGTITFDSYKGVRFNRQKENSWLLRSPNPEFGGGANAYENDFVINLQGNGYPEFRMTFGDRNENDFTNVEAYLGGGQLADQDWVEKHYLGNGGAVEVKSDSIQLSKSLEFSGGNYLQIPLGIEGQVAPRGLFWPENRNGLFFKRPDGTVKQVVFEDP